MSVITISKMSKMFYLLKYNTDINFKLNKIFRQLYILRLLGKKYISVVVSRQYIPIEWYKYSC